MTRVINFRGAFRTLILKRIANPLTVMIAPSLQESVFGILTRPSADYHPLNSKRKDSGK